MLKSKQKAQNIEFPALYQNLGCMSRFCHADQAFFDFLHFFSTIGKFLIKVKSKTQENAGSRQSRGKRRRL